MLLIFKGTNENIIQNDNICIHMYTAAVLYTLAIVQYKEGQDGYKLRVQYYRYSKALMETLF